MRRAGRERATSRRRGRWAGCARRVGRVELAQQLLAVALNPLAPGQRPAEDLAPLATCHGNIIPDLVYE